MLADQSNKLEFDPVTSISSGQTFLWDKIGDAWYGVNGQNVLKFRVENDKVEYSAFSEHKSWERELFRLDDDIKGIFATLSRDRTAATLFARYPGLRLLRQDPEQCLFSFVCASNTNIPMIRRMLHNMIRKFGDKVNFDGREFFMFPSSRALNSATVGELQSCGLGYRAKAIKAAARAVTDGGLDLGDLRNAELQEARDQLLQIYGVGNKIADCVLLFSLDKLDAFPIDVWIARALSTLYSEVHERRFGEKLSPHQYELISGIMRRHFGRYAGYAQQYLYYDIRHIAQKKW